jgi:hypothetical protein
MMTSSPIIIPSNISDSEPDNRKIVPPTLITHTEIINQIKFIFAGCDTIIDAMHFGNQYIEKYPHMKSLILSYMNGKRYRDIVDIKTKQNALNDVIMCETQDEALAVLSKHIEKTTDDVYRKTLERIAYKKYYRKTDRKQKNIQHNISKKCPHCSHIVNMPDTTQYIICGYTNPVIGYDWNGCGGDWCFQCNKMLCKKWEIDNLHLEMNRHHDDECCASHAKANGYRFPDDYCQCNNINLLTSLIH